MHMPHWSLLVFLAGALATAARPLSAQETTDYAPSINQWLVLGPFANYEANAGFGREWFDETRVSPVEGIESAGETWRYFDDRLFSRNLDDYQDLFSYFRTVRGEPIEGAIAYAHVYIHSEDAQDAQLRIGADNEFAAKVNGQVVASETEGHPFRDEVSVDVGLRVGWNRLLLKVGTQSAGRFGFYARLGDEEGGRLPGLTYSVNGGERRLAVSTKPMADTDSGSLPAAYRDWPYFGVRAADVATPDSEIRLIADRLWRDDLAMHSSEFRLMAEGGAPPYRWSLAGGELPEGLAFLADGVIAGTVAEEAPLGDYAVEVQVTDAQGETASRELTMTVRERPNKWFEEARLTALIHGPERLKDEELPRFATLMKRQGYAIGMVISYNNGGHKYRWPSIYEPDNPWGDVVGKYKAALEAEGIKFGMYMGNLNGPNHGGDNGAILMVEEAMKRYQPAALWFDWAGWQGVSLDALYSMIRSIDPETVIVLNGVQTIGNGDWDIIEVEGWSGWGDNHWGVWPFDVPWPKRAAVEAWRLVADPAFEYSKDVEPDWQDYLRLQISLIGQGFVANIDHSPTIASSIVDGKLTSLDDSVVWRCHERMADWAHPPDSPPLHESYTKVNPGPIWEAEWGYSVMNLERDVIYLHMIEDPFGKMGMPDADALTVGAIEARATEVRWMNGDRKLPFEQEGRDLTIDVSDVTADPIDTILRIGLAEPHPKVERPERQTMAFPPGNLASRRPARLLGFTGENTVPPSGLNIARYGVDGTMTTAAQGANEWAWTYEVDLEDVHRVWRIVIHMERGYATEYRVHLSADGAQWTTVADVTGCEGGRLEHTLDDPIDARYVRIQSIKPDGPNQPGAQMSIAELEVYE